MFGPCFNSSTSAAQRRPSVRHRLWSSYGRRARQREGGRDGDASLPTRNLFAGVGRRRGRRSNDPRQNCEGPSARTDESPLLGSGRPTGVPRLVDGIWRGRRARGTRRRRTEPYPSEPAHDRELHGRCSSRQASPLGVQGVRRGGDPKEARKRCRERIPRRCSQGVVTRTAKRRTVCRPP